MLSNKIPVQKLDGILKFVPALVRNDSMCTLHTHTYTHHTYTHHIHYKVTTFRKLLLSKRRGYVVWCVSYAMQEFLLFASDVQGHAEGCRNAVEGNASSLFSVTDDISDKIGGLRAEIRTSSVPYTNEC